MVVDLTVLRGLATRRATRRNFGPGTDFARPPDRTAARGYDLRLSGTSSARGSLVSSQSGTSGTPGETSPWYGYPTAGTRSQQAAALRAAIIALTLLAALVLVIWF